MKISIIYWTSTGNTEKMAEYIAEGMIRSRIEKNRLLLKNVHYN